jgi:hypothetical protein
VADDPKNVEVGRLGNVSGESPEVDDNVDGLGGRVIPFRENLDFGGDASLGEGGRKSVPEMGIAPIRFGSFIGHGDLDRCMRGLYVVERSSQKLSGAGGVCVTSEHLLAQVGDQALSLCFVLEVVVDTSTQVGAARIGR